MIERDWTKIRDTQQQQCPLIKELSCRAQIALARLGIISERAARAVHNDELLQVPNCGKTTTREIRAAFPFSISEDDPSINFSAALIPFAREFRKASKLLERCAEEIEAACIKSASIR